MSYAWTSQQAAALKKIVQWAKSPGGPQVMRLFGWAGTGKTFLARAIGDELGGALFCAPTGKAALVLKKNGCYNASTIHSLIYKAIEGDDGKITYKLNPESPMGVFRLAVCDEASMVDNYVGQDMLSFGTKVLALGDPFQLKPVNGAGFFTSVEPDIMLTEIRRQALDSPIIRLSMDIREGRGLKVGQYGESLVARRSSMSKEDVRMLVDEADQILCGRNKTRQTLNTRVRQLAGAPDDAPRVDDKLVCLKNNREKGLLNGGLWKVTRVKRYGNQFQMKVTTNDDPDIIDAVDVVTPIEYFRGEEDKIDWKAKKWIDQFTYGYALTVHKSQGSQWDYPLVFDESEAFREQAPNHLYTAITRAVQRVTVLL